MSDSVSPVVADVAEPLDGRDDAQAKRWLATAPLTADIRKNDRFNVVPIVVVDDDYADSFVRPEVIQRWAQLQGEVLFVGTRTAYYYGRLVGADEDNLTVHPLGDITTYEIDWDDLRMIGRPQLIEKARKPGVEPTEAELDARAGRTLAELDAIDEEDARKGICHDLNDVGGKAVELHIQLEGATKLLIEAADEKGCPDTVGSVRFIIESLTTLAKGLSEQIEHLHVDVMGALRA